MAKEKAEITIHARKSITRTYGTTYVGYIQCKDGPIRRSRSTHICRLTREDALADAARQRDELLQISLNA